MKQEIDSETWKMYYVLYTDHSHVEISITIFDSGLLNSSKENSVDFSE